MTGRTKLGFGIVAAVLFIFIVAWVQVKYGFRQSTAWDVNNSSLRTEEYLARIEAKLDQLLKSQK